MIEPKMRILILAALLCLSACGKPSQETKETSNLNFKVEKLFTYEDCTVYRFIDDHYVYYTNCSSTTSFRNCGKACSIRDEVRTNHD